MSSVKIDIKIVSIEGDINQKKLIEKVKNISYTDIEMRKLTLSESFNQSTFKGIKYIYFDAPFSLEFRILGGKANFLTSYGELEFTEPETVQFLYKNTAVDPVDNEDNRVTIIIAR